MDKKPHYAVISSKGELLPYTIQEKKIRSLEEFIYRYGFNWEHWQKLGTRCVQVEITDIKPTDK